MKPLFERFNHLMLRRLQNQLRAAEEAMRRQGQPPIVPPPGTPPGDRPTPDA
jgi:hypothetical protein